MTLRKYLALGLLTLVGSLSSGLALAQGMGPGGPPGGPGGPGGPMDGPRTDGLHPLMMLLRNASLTTAQQDQVHQLMTAHRTQVEPLLDRLHTLNDQIADKLLGSSAVVTAQDMSALRSESSQLQEQIDASDMDTALKIRNLLNADQRTHLASVHRQVKSLRDQLDALLRPGSPSAGQRP